MYGKWLTGFFLLTLAFLLTGCSNLFTSKIVHTTTPLHAAKAFVGALTSGSIVQLNQTVYRNQTMDTNKLMNIAKARKIVGMSSKAFSYRVDPKDKETVYVSFKDKTGELDTWKLVFVQNAAHNYQFDGYLSGTLLANSTPETAIHTYLTVLRKNKESWINSINETPRLEGDYSGKYSLEVEYIRAKGIKNASHVTIYKKQPPKLILFANTSFKDGSKHRLLFEMIKRSDGYYYESYIIDPDKNDLRLVAEGV